MVSRLRKVGVSKRQAVLYRRLLPLPETVMESFSYPQFPRDVSTVYIALFDRVSNAAEIRSRLVKAVSMTGPEGEHEREIMNFAFIDARLVSIILFLHSCQRSLVPRSVVVYIYRPLSIMPPWPIYRNLCVRRLFIRRCSGFLIQVIMYGSYIMGAEQLIANNLMLRFPRQYDAMECPTTLRRFSSCE